MNRDFDEPTETQDRTPSIPANLELERAVLGSILIDPDAIVEVAELLIPADFFRQRHGWIYEAMLDLSNRSAPIDFETLADELERKGQLVDVGGPAALTDLIGSTPTSMNVLYYARQVLDYARRRRMLEVMGKGAEKLYDMSIPTDDVLMEIEMAVTEAAADRRKRNERKLGELLLEVVNDIDEGTRNGGVVNDVVPTGFTMIDRLMGGMRKGDLSIWAARPGMGKSALAIQIARNAAKRYGKSTLILSLEMTGKQIARRILASETGIDSNRLKNAQLYENEWPILLEGANVAAGYDITVDDTPGVNSRDIRRAVLRAMKLGPLDLVIIDHMHLMGTTNTRRNSNAVDDMSEISRSLKILAREFNIPVMALSQLSRALETRADKRPQLSDLRQSGTIEQDADVVIGLYREDYYDDESERQNLVDILFLKQREGTAPATASLYFRKELSEFRDLEIQRTELEY